jgi:hypothetical protein
MGSWPISAEYVTGSPTLRARTISPKAVILGVVREPTAGYDVNGRSFYLTADGVQYTVSFSSGPLTLAQVIDVINNVGGAPGSISPAPPQDFAFRDNGFLRLEADDGLQIDSVPASTPTDVLYNLGLFPGVSATQGDYAHIPHIDPSRQISLPGQISVPEGEDLGAGTFNRIAYQLSANIAHNDAVIHKKRVASLQETGDITYASPATDEGYQFGGGTYVFVGVTPTTQAEFEKHFVVMDPDGNELTVDDDVEGASTSCVYYPESGGQMLRCTVPGTELFFSTDDDGNVFIRIDGVTDTSDLEGGNESSLQDQYLKVTQYISPREVLAIPVLGSGAGEEAGQRIFLGGGDGTSLPGTHTVKRVVRTRTKVYVSDIKNVDGGSSVVNTPVARTGFSALALSSADTRIDLNDRIVIDSAALGVDFISAGVEVGDLLTWAGYSSSIIDNNGVYRVSKVIDKETIELLGSDWTPVILNPDVTTVGNITITSDGNFYKDPFIVFNIDPTTNRGTDFAVVYRGMTTLKAATDDPSVFGTAGTLRYKQEASDIVNRVLKSLIGPSISELTDFTNTYMEDERFSVEDIYGRLQAEHWDHREEQKYSKNASWTFGTGGSVGDTITDSTDISTFGIQTGDFVNFQNDTPLSTNDDIKLRVVASPASGDTVLQVESGVYSAGTYSGTITVTRGGAVGGHKDIRPRTVDMDEYVDGVGIRLYSTAWDQTFSDSTSPAMIGLKLNGSSVDYSWWVDGLGNMRQDTGGEYAVTLGTPSSVSGVLGLNGTGAWTHGTVYYAVTAVDVDGVESPASSVIGPFTPSPPTTDSITISFDGVPGAAYYKIYEDGSASMASPDVVATVAASDYTGDAGSHTVIETSSRTPGSLPSDTESRSMLLRSDGGESSIPGPLTVGSTPATHGLTVRARDLGGGASAGLSIVHVVGGSFPGEDSLRRRMDATFSRFTEYFEDFDFYGGWGPDHRIEYSMSGLGTIYYGWGASPDWGIVLTPRYSSIGLGDFYGVGSDADANIHILDTQPLVRMAKEGSNKFDLKVDSSTEDLLLTPNGVAAGIRMDPAGGVVIGDIATDPSGWTLRVDGSNVLFDQGLNSWGEILSIAGIRSQKSGAHAVYQLSTDQHGGTPGTLTATALTTWGNSASGVGVSVGAPWSVFIAGGDGVVANAITHDSGINTSADERVLIGAGKSVLLLVDCESSSTVKDAAEFKETGEVALLGRPYGASSEEVLTVGHDNSLINSTPYAQRWARTRFYGEGDDEQETGFIRSGLVMVNDDTVNEHYAPCIEIGSTTDWGATHKVVAGDAAETNGSFIKLNTLSGRVKIEPSAGGNSRLQMGGTDNLGAGASVTGQAIDYLSGFGFYFLYDISSPSNWLLRLDNTAGIVAKRHVLPDTDNTYDLGSTSAWWRNVYASALFYKTGGEPTTFDTEDDLALIEAYSPGDTMKRVDKGGVAREVAIGRPETIPWPMLGPVSEDGQAPWLDASDSIFFLTGAIKQLYQKHKAEVTRYDETVADLTARLDAMQVILDGLTSP